MGTPNIELLTSPSSIILVDNGIDFVVQSNRLWNASAASLSITFPNDQTAYAGKFFELTIGEDIFTFYFVANPDQSGMQLN